MRLLPTRAEWLSGGLFLGIAALWVGPRIYRVIDRTRRSEAVFVLESLQATALKGKLGIFDGAPRSAEEVDGRAVPWTGAGDWRPPIDAVRCSYSHAGGVLAATCDVDGDGRRATYRGPVDGVLRRTTPDDVF